jgi:Ala-tRNA(Pro) deacylase
MTKEETYQYLKEHNVAFEITEHGAVFNMEELKSVELPYPEADAKNLFVRDDKKRNYYLITVKGDKRVDLKEFRKKHELRPLSFASADELMDIMKLYPGAVSPLGLLSDDEHKVMLFLDEAFGTGLIGVHPNDNTATIWLQTADLERIIKEHGNIVEIVNIDI